MPGRVVPSCFVGMVPVNRVLHTVSRGNHRGMRSVGKRRKAESER